MDYRFKITYKATDSDSEDTREVFPLWGDSLTMDISREDKGWTYGRKLNGVLTFVGIDYEWILGCAFDGSYVLTIEESHDGGVNWYEYFTGGFSRTSLTIDKDNQAAELSGLSEGWNNLIDNGRGNTYDLMKIIPDSKMKEVVGSVPSALALVNYSRVDVTESDIYCGGAYVGSGYADGKCGWAESVNVGSNALWRLVAVCGEAYVETNGEDWDGAGLYSGMMSYSRTSYGDYGLTSVNGRMTNANGWRMVFSIAPSSVGRIIVEMYFEDPSGVRNIGTMQDYNVIGEGENYYNPVSLLLDDWSNTNVSNVEMRFYYIRAALLTYSSDGVNENVLDTGGYYKGIQAFAGDGLGVAISTRTSEQPNGYRMVPGSDADGGSPEYYAAPDEGGGWIPLSQGDWDKVSLWYKIEPSVANGLLDRTKYGNFRWAGCWTIGTCLSALLNKITEGNVMFDESEAYSKFLYGNPNPVADGEPFSWLVTQKSNVMYANGESASRCEVTLDWFLQLLENAFNCYYWIEKMNDGRYMFRVEHVEYFRRGGSYDRVLSYQMDLTNMIPRRNFEDGGVPVKRYADGTNKYSFDMDGMVERYLFSWQGDGGGDDFKGHPMVFKAGWIEKGMTDSKQVDNIFADLGWLMLNAGTSTESSRNFSGLMLFGGYRRYDVAAWEENGRPQSRWLSFGQSRNRGCHMWITAPEGYNMGMDTGTEMLPVVGTGVKQCVEIGTGVLRYDFGEMYSDVVIHRIHAIGGDVYAVPNVENLLRGGYIQNGVLAWPWLQNEYLHYDVPSMRWGYTGEDAESIAPEDWKTNGTIKLVKKQTVGVVPMPNRDPDTSRGVKTGLGIGIIESAQVNLTSRNVELTLLHEIM